MYYLLGVTDSKMISVLLILGKMAELSLKCLMIDKAKQGDIMLKCSQKVMALNKSDCSSFLVQIKHTTRLNNDSFYGYSSFLPSKNMH